MSSSAALLQLSPSASISNPGGMALSATRAATLNLPVLSYPSPTITMGGNSLNDGRVRISMFSGSPAIFYNDPKNILLRPLQTTYGVLFPFQPKVDISFSANYQQQKVNQSNFIFNTYENSEIKNIDLTCNFPARNVLEGQYVIAVTTFLRSLTMMFTGNDGSLAGSPPLIVKLTGMGFGGLDYIPVSISNITSSFPNNIDYVTIPINIPYSNGELTRVPTMTSISVSCVPMFSRAFATKFSALDFSSGKKRLIGPTIGS